MNCLCQEADTMAFSKTKKDFRAIPKNSVYLELGGPALLVSFNYERVFPLGKCLYLSGRTGIGDLPSFYNTLSVPFMMNGMYQVSNSFLLELGIGVNLTYTFWPDSQGGGGIFDSGPVESGSFFDPLLTCLVGIRVQSKKGFLFRLGFTPLIELTKNSEKGTLNKQFGMNTSFVPWAGISFGYSFKVRIKSKQQGSVFRSP